MSALRAPRIERRAGAQAVAILITLVRLAPLDPEPALRGPASPVAPEATLPAIPAIPAFKYFEDFVTVVSFVVPTVPNYDTRMEVRVYGNTRRPGVGMQPKREGSRPLLPQHARHCPVLEAGSALGFMVYAALEPKESLYVEFEGDGRYRFIYYLQTQEGKRAPIFQVTMSLSVGGIGMMKEEVTFVGAPMLSREAALAVMRAFLVPEDMGTPAGAIALRGATNFQTPSGWDTVYTPILNMIERPVAPMLSIRVETDWYSHETEFRYVLQPGEGITVEHSIPIGQVFFVPREQITMRQCSAEELKAIEASRDEFNREKAAATQQTSYGLSYSPHYLRQSRAQKE